MLTIAALLVLGITTAAVSTWTVRHLPEPPKNLPDIETKKTYRSVATWRFGATCGIGAIIVASTATTFLPIWAWPIWLCLATCGVTIAAIDGATTWIPTVLTRISTGGLIIATAVSALALHTPPNTLFWIIAGAGITTALFLALALIANLGMGDARFAPLVGAAMGVSQLPGIATGLITGFLIVAATGPLYRRITNQKFVPFAPGILAGTVVSAFTGAF